MAWRKGYRNKELLRNNLCMEDCMKKRIINYRKRIDSLIADAPEGTDWEAVLREHLTQVSFFSHERLIHLIVTVTFALMTMIGLAVCCIVDCMPVFAIVVLLLTLLIPYVGHYYTLENEVQKMYGQYDRILHNIQSKNHGRSI